MTVKNNDIVTGTNAVILIIDGQQETFQLNKILGLKIELINGIVTKEVTEKRCHRYTLLNPNTVVKPTTQSTKKKKKIIKTTDQKPGRLLTAPTSELSSAYENWLKEELNETPEEIIPTLVKQFNTNKATLLRWLNSIRQQQNGIAADKNSEERLKDILGEL